MNTKTAKRLRKEAMYHPSMPREYVTVNHSTRKRNSGSIELKESDRRVLYKELKKEFKSNKGVI